MKWLCGIMCVIQGLLGGGSLALAAIQPAEVSADKTIQALYHTLNHDTTSRDVTTRLAKISAFFLGTPYVLTALGEGNDARYDQFPRYRTDAFDCETYVTTVIALALADNVAAFRQQFYQLRYQGGTPSFLQRHHFTELDWNHHNAEKGFIRDITLSFHDQEGCSVAKIATALIDKPSWYAHLTEKIIRLASPMDAKKRQTRLVELKLKGSTLPRADSKLPYLPWNALFLKNGMPNKTILAQIPHGAVLEIVRPNWQQRDTIGTNLNVSHLGFVFWKQGTPFFRQASSVYGRVVDVPLIAYLEHARQSPTIGGVNVQVVVMKNHPISQPINTSNRS